jgi:signal transduction histidine kinase
MSSEQERVGLRSYLRERLTPLVVLLFFVVSISAPVAYYIMGSRTVEATAQATARQVARIVREEAELRPRLWRYEADRIVDYTRRHAESPSIVRIDLLDGAGRQIDLGHPQRDPTGLFWVREAVVINDNHVGEVWVGATTAELVGDSLGLLGAFGGIGLILATLLFVVPLRATGAAETHIVALIRRLEESSLALEQFNLRLEGLVAERSKQLAEALHEITELSSRAVSMQEAERRAISRELHDSAGQALTAVRLNLQIIESQLEMKSIDSHAVGERARKAMSVLDGALEEIRRVVHRLAPVVLDEVGLRSAIERQCIDAADRSGIEVNAQVEIPESLGQGLDITCYRLVQEALTNVSRHAHASQVTVTVTADVEAVHIEISDDGVGFDLEDALAKGRRGVRGMRERVELLGGSFDLVSAPGKGTTLRVELPLGREEADVSPAW